MTEDKPKNKVGRPTKYKEEYKEQTYKLCLLGATDEELGGFFEVDESTINNWKRDYPQFLESIKRGKIQADAEVAEKLFKRATGYEHDSIHFSSYDGEVTETPFIKHYPPDTAAAFIWLKNRRNWRDKTDITSGGDKIQPIAVCPVLSSKAKDDNVDKVEPQVD